jgi:transcriptional regulator with XRE-family HTH domain
MAAAADMDPSHLGKAERGERLPTPEQTLALAGFLGVPEGEMKSRFYAARMWLACDGDPTNAVGAAPRVQEHAASYLVNKQK